MSECALSRPYRAGPAAQQPPAASAPCIYRYMPAAWCSHHAAICQLQLQSLCYTAQAPSSEVNRAPGGLLCPHSLCHCRRAHQPAGECACQTAGLHCPADTLHDTCSPASLICPWWQLQETCRSGSAALRAPPHTYSSSVGSHGGGVLVALLPLLADAQSPAPPPPSPFPRRPCTQSLRCSQGLQPNPIEGISPSSSVMPTYLTKSSWRRW